MKDKLHPFALAPAPVETPTTPESVVIPADELTRLEREARPVDGPLVRRLVAYIRYLEGR
jgi:hypothetical protein